MKLFFYAALFSLLFACGPAQKQEEPPADPYASLPEDFATVLRTHGGLEKWKSFGTLEFDLQHEEDSVPTEHYTLDLVNRKDLTVADSFKIGYDGTNVWVSPNRQAFKGRSARFYHNLYSYFLTIPFIVADPGVLYESDTLRVNQKLYDVINVRFEKGVGDADQDTYKMLIDPDTHKMEMLLYTVTFYSGQAHENYNALSYEDYVDVNGLQLASKLVGYKYSSGQTGDKRYEVNFANILFKEERPSGEIFEILAAAEIDSMKVN